VGDDKEVVLLALELEDDGLEAHSKIMVRLCAVSRSAYINAHGYIPLRGDICGGRDPSHVSPPLLDIIAE